MNWSMLTLYKVVDTSRYPKAQRPRWRVPNAASIVGAVVTAVGGLALLGLDPLDLRFAYRLALAVVLAATVWTVGMIAPALPHLVARMRNYQELREHALTLESLLAEERYRTRMLAIRLSYVASANDALPVIGIILGDANGHDLLALDNIHGTGHSIGDKVMIIDSLTWDFLGSFEIVGQTRDAIVAAPTDTPDSLWWGYLHQQAMVHAQANTRAVAIRVQD